MTTSFKDLKWTIEEGLANDIPFEAKLMLWGRVLEAYMSNEMTYQESRQLEDLLALPPEALQFKSFALTGDEKEYQELVEDGEIAASSQS